MTNLAAGDTSVGSTPIRGGPTAASSVRSGCVGVAEAGLRRTEPESRLYRMDVLAKDGAEVV